MGLTGLWRMVAAMATAVLATMEMTTHLPLTHLGRNTARVRGRKMPPPRRPIDR